MKILCIDQFSELGGAQQCLRDLAPFMTDAGFKLSAMLPPGGPLVDSMRRAGVPVDELPIGAYACGPKTASDVLRFPVDTLRAASAIRRAVDRDRIDLVYVNGPRVLPAAVLAGVPIVFHAHNVVGHGYARALLRWCFHRFDGPVIAVSRFVANTLAGLLPSDRLKVVHNGVFAPAPAERNFKGSSPWVGIVGRISPEKGHLDFIRAAGIVARADPDVRFVVVGAPMFSKTPFSGTTFDETLRQMPESSRIRFLGWSDDIPGSFAKIDILAVPSAEEPFGRVVIEAFAAGTPVVAYPSGGIPELIEHGRTGLLTRAFSAESLAAEIRFLIERPGEMLRLSAAGRKEFERRFTLERFARNVCGVLSEAKLKSGPQQPGQDPRVMPDPSYEESHAQNATSHS